MCRSIIRSPNRLFGQSLTAIIKLAPDANMGETLPVHYSGGTSLESDIAAWLKINGISDQGVQR